MLFSKSLLPLATLGMLAAAATERTFSTIQPSSSDIAAEAAVAPVAHSTSNVEGAVFNRFVVIWLENTDFDKAAESDGLHWLAQYGKTLTNYWAVTHPSEPNYVASAGGDYFGIEDDNFNRLPANVSNVADLLEYKDIAWGEYQEHMPYAGFQGFEYVNQESGANDYVRKHNPLIHFDNIALDETRRSNIKNFTTFYEDLENETLPQWMFITPNMTNDGHDTTINVAADWTRSFMEPLLCNEYFMKDTLVLITFDETETYTIKNRVFALLLGGALPEDQQGTVDDTFYDHYSEIATVEANWNLPNLGRNDANANVFALVADALGIQNDHIDTTYIANNHTYDGWVTDDTLAFPAPNVNAVNKVGNGVLPAISSVWADAYSSELNASYFTSTTTLVSWGTVPDVTVASSLLTQSPSPLDCVVSSSDIFSSESSSIEVSSSAEESSSAVFPSSSIEVSTLVSSSLPSSSETSSTITTESSTGVTSTEETSFSVPTEASSTLESSLTEDVSSPLSSETLSTENSSAPAESSTPSSTESSSSSRTSSTASPYFTGYFNGGNPKWQLTFPGSLGPWSSVSLAFGKGNSTGGFSFSDCTVTVGGESSSEAAISVSDGSVSVDVDFSIELDEDLVFEIDAEITSGSSWTSFAHIALTTPSGKKFFKRAETTWDLTDTIFEDPAAVSSSISSAEAISAVSTSTATDDEQSTTVVTITSCSDNACSLEAVTTGVTVLTETLNGTVTEYTTYCPLTGESTTTEAPATTVITITSCSDNVCSEIPVTTGLTTITETSEGVSTSAATGTTTNTPAEGTTSDTATSTEEATSSPAVTTFEGKAAGIATGTALFGLMISLLMI